MPLVQANVTQPSMERRRHKADIDGSQCRAKGGDCQVSTTFMPNRSTHTCPCSSNPRPRSFKKHQYSSAIWKHPNTPAKLKTERFMPCSVLPPPPSPAQPNTQPRLTARSAHAQVAGTPAAAPLFHAGSPRTHHLGLQTPAGRGGHRAAAGHT